MERNRKTRDTDLSPRERYVLQEIVFLLGIAPLPPTLEEIGKRVGQDRTAVHYWVRRLERKGWIKSRPRESRSIELLRPLPQAKPIPGVR